jgi:3-isopropylmalate/(R)-2-methylmalate dehydratase small subunit
MSKIKGRVRKFCDNIDTDIITPASTLQLPIGEIKKHAFEPIFPEFYKTVKEGDIIVGGMNFGCGSSREQATEVVKELGILYIVCESIARIYFRNCVALGMYPLECKGISQFVDEGTEIEIDIEKATLKKLSTGEIVPIKTLSGMPIEISKTGGILPYLKNKMAKAT